MNGIIRIFSRETKDIRDITAFLERYVTKNFKEYFKKIEIQEHYRLDMRVIDWNEILLMFDEELLPTDLRKSSLRQRLGKGEFQSDLLKAAYSGTIKNCDRLELPYIIYEKELSSRQEYLLIFLEGELEKVRGKITERLKLVF